jgi:molecular chaperone DnaK
VADLIERTIGPCRQALEDAGTNTSDIDEVVLVGGQTRMPKVQAQVTQLFGRDPHRGVNPDEVVAVGAAIQAAVLAGDVKGVVLLDVTPLSLGVETQGGLMTVLIPRNTTIPAQKAETFSTAADNQTSVDIHVLQGERPLARENRTLGRFQLTGIPPAPRGAPEIEVSFDIDANGILNVSARDVRSGRQQQITITSSSGLGKDEVDRMVKEAEAHASEDVRRREEIELRNETDALVYSAERTLREQGRVLSDGERRPLEQKIAEAREALNSQDLDRIRRAKDELTRAGQALDEAIARAAATTAGRSGQPPSPGSPAENDVIDAEVVDDRK